MNGTRHNYMAIRNVLHIHSSLLGSIIMGVDNPNLNCKQKVSWKAGDSC